ncbi:MAG: hypothetical protein QF662_03755, partial [Phycisphaerae bacterium]|nr:hypothetical protein [Phycisphaerae bacterium]
RKFKIPDGLRGHFTVLVEIEASGGKKIEKRASFVIVPRRKKGFKDPDECYFSIYNWHIVNELHARLGVGLQMLEVTGSWKIPDTPAAYDKLVYSPGRKLGISFAVRPWRDTNNNTRAPKDMAEFGEFVYGVADYFSKKGATHFDTWNEPQFWLAGTKMQTARVMKETYMSIRRANPKATIAGPGLLGNMSYNRQLLRAAKKVAEKEGLEEHFPFYDIHNIHYGPFPYETEYVKYIRRHRALLDEFDVRKHMLMWNTEMSPPSGHVNNKTTHDPKRYWHNIAKYWLRQCLVGFPEGVRHNLIFMMGSVFRGSGSINVRNFSASNWEATQMYASVATAIDQIEATRYEKKLDMDENVWVLQFRRKDNGRNLVLWTFEDTSTSPWTNRVVTVKIPVKSKTVVHVDMMGMAKTLEAKDGVVEVRIDGRPSYLQDPPRGKE